MRINRYLESLRGNLNRVSRAEIDCFRAYDMAIRYNLPYPLMVEKSSEPLHECCEVFSRVGIAKFGYAFPCTSTTDDLALAYKNGYTIVGTCLVQSLLSEDEWHTSCKYVLIMGKRRVSK